MSIRQMWPSPVVDGLPDGGWHEPGGPVFGPDELLYFGQGSVSQQGVVLPQGFTVDVAKHPLARDVPGQGVTLTGHNVWSRDPLMPYPYLVESGAFKPFGEPAKAGEAIKGELRCNSAIWRARPDGSEMELLAWGLRNPYGMAISDEGELYASDNDFEEKSERAIAAAHGSTPPSTPATPSAVASLVADTITPVADAPASVGPLRDLHAVYLMACETQLACKLAGQAASGLHDTELVALLHASDDEARTQLDWVRTYLRGAAPQVLLAAG